MMRLYIDGTEYPFDDTQRLHLSYSSAVLRSVDAARTGTCVELRIPSTPQTDTLFGGARDPLAAGSFNDSEHTARIECDGAAIHSGTAVLSGTESDGCGGAWYRLSVTGGGAQWAKHAARSMFNAIPISFSMRLTPVQIARSWSDSGPVKFLPVIRDTYEPTYSSVSLMPAEKILSTDDYHPYISVRELLKAIFAQSGYTLRSRFIDGGYFGSLMVSGAYASSDTDAVRARMDFRAGRTADAQSTADSTGRVYFSPYMTVSSAGNFADTFTSDDGSLFSRNGCFAIENRRTVFRPLTSVKVGFEYTINYVTDYRIATRQRLTGFDSVYTPATGQVVFGIANRFADRRDGLSPYFDYRAVVFNHTAGSRYRIVCSSSAGEHVMGQFSARSAMVSTGSASWYGNPTLYVASASGAWVPYQGDWALYDGYIQESGQTEVSFVLRTPSQEASPTSPVTFDLMYMSGAEAGMTLRLLSSSTLCPVFSSNAGYDSLLAFDDIARHEIRQGAFVEAVRQMFNMVIFTDEESKTVYIEPAADFYGGSLGRSVDWSSRIDTSHPVATSDLSLEAHDTLTLGYRDDDGAVRRFNTAEESVFGQWQAVTGRYGSIEGDLEMRNPMFSPTINIAGRYVNAPSALLMQVCDRDDPEQTSASGFSPRIVRWMGMQPLPEGERWGYPSSAAEYPLAAFHLPAADGDATTLCYEDRDGARGLHRFYDDDVERMRHARRVTLRLHITPDEWASLRQLGGMWPNIASRFRLTVEGQTGEYLLDAADDYDPRDGMALCRFIQADTSIHNH